MMIHLLPLFTGKWSFITANPANKIRAPNLFVSQPCAFEVATKYYPLSPSMTNAFFPFTVVLMVLLVTDVVVPVWKHAYDVIF